MLPRRISDKLNNIKVKFNSSDKTILRWISLSEIEYDVDIIFISAQNAFHDIDSIETFGEHFRLFCEKYGDSNEAKLLITVFDEFQDEYNVTFIKLFGEYFGCKGHNQQIFKLLPDHIQKGVTDYSSKWRAVFPIESRTMIKSECIKAVAALRQVDVNDENLVKKVNELEQESFSRSPCITKYCQLILSKLYTIKPSVAVTSAHGTLFSEGTQMQRNSNTESMYAALVNIEQTCSIVRNTTSESSTSTTSSSNNGVLTLSSTIKQLKERFKTMLLFSGNLQTNLPDNMEIVSNNTLTNTRIPKIRPAEINSALIHAAQEGNLDFLDNLDRLGNIDINLSDNWGNTALSAAVSHNQLKFLKRLLQLPNINIYEINKHGNTILMNAARADFNIFEYMVSFYQAKQTPASYYTAVDRDGKTAFLVAASRQTITGADEENKKTNSNVAAILRMMLTLPNLFDFRQRDSKGRNALMLVASDWTNCVERIEILLSVLTENVNDVDSENKTALTYAVELGNLEVAKRLLQVPGIVPQDTIVDYIVRHYADSSDENRMNRLDNFLSHFFRETNVDLDVRKEYHQRALATASSVYQYNRSMLSRILQKLEQINPEPSKRRNMGSGLTNRHFY